MHDKSLRRYVAIGGLAFAVDYGTLLVSYYVFSLHLAVATTLGYMAGLVVSFVSNRLWVFGSHGRDRHFLLQSVEYGMLVLFNYCFTVFWVRFLNDYDIKPYVSKVLVMAAIVCWNYVLYKKVIFVAKQADDSQPV